MSTSFSGFDMRTAGPKGRDVRVYDFRRPHRASKESLRTLEAMYERLTKGLESWLVSRVRAQAEVRLINVEQFSFGEFTLSQPVPCSAFIFDIAETGMKGVIDIGPELCTYLVDRLFGGTGVGRPLSRALTPIERMAVRSVADRCATLLEDIWREYVTLDLNITSFESSPEMLQVINREDPVLVANLEFRTNTVSSLLVICLPFSVLDRFFMASSRQLLALHYGSEVDREAARQRSEAAVRVTDVEVRATLPTFRMSLGQLAQLKEGMIIPTTITRDAPILLSTDGQERFRGHAGRVNGKLAVRVTESCIPDLPDTLSLPSA
ncbi:MAG: FliM/FliN family flagellar motor switch protein [Gemmatimonadetes bacterium]|nr:FliM/FliN family flagellar motor switch protein [Gemmatimonadota bacterium]